MKYVLPIIVFMFLLELVTPKALPAGRQVLAATSVNIENNGEGVSSEVQVENSNGESTVCINGKCETSKDGNIERQEGGAKVKVEEATRSAVKETALEENPGSTPEQHIDFGEIIRNFGRFVVSLIS